MRRQRRCDGTTTTTAFTKQKQKQTDIEIALECLSCASYCLSCALCTAYLRVIVIGMNSMGLHHNSCHCSFTHTHTYSPSAIGSHRNASSRKRISRKPRPQRRVRLTVVAVPNTVAHNHITHTHSRTHKSGEQNFLFWSHVAQTPHDGLAVIRN